MADPEPDADEWLTIAQAAIRTGYTQDAIRERIRQGKLSSAIGDHSVVQIALRGLTELPPLNEFWNVHGHGEQVAQNPAQVVQELTIDLIMRAMDNPGTDPNRPIKVPYNP